jgi:hypothetical protein
MHEHRRESDKVGNKIQFWIMIASFIAAFGSGLGGLCNNIQGQRDARYVSVVLASQEVRREFCHMLDSAEHKQDSINDQADSRRDSLEAFLMACNLVTMTREQTERARSMMGAIYRGKQ